MSDKKEIDLIFKHIHPDYKGLIDGVKSIMYYNNGTAYGPISEMPKSIYDQYLLDAQAKEETL